MICNSTSVSVATPAASMTAPESTEVERLLDPSFLPLVGLLDDVTFDEEFLRKSARPFPAWARRSSLSAATA